MCPHCRAFITTSDKICPYCDTPVGPRAIDMRTGFFAELIPSAQFATITILTLNVGIFVLTLLASVRAGTPVMQAPDGMTLFRFGSSIPMQYAEWHWWRLLTAGFLHGGLMHIGFNCWALMDVGTHAEQVYGTRRMTAIYLLATMGGFLVSGLTGHVSVGASAGLFGLIGAMIAYGTFNHGLEASMVKQFYVRWMIYGLLMGFLFPGVDNMAHVGGLATGFLAAWATGTPGYYRDFRDKLWDTLAGGMIALTAYAFVRLVLWMTTAGSVLG